MIRHFAMVASIGLTFLTVQPIVADEEWEKLDTEYDSAYERWQEGMKKLQGEGKGGVISFNPSSMPQHPIEDFRPKFRKYAEKHAGKPEALPALCKMLTPGLNILGMGDTNKSTVWALSQLKKDHAADPKIQDYIQELRFATMSVGEDSVVEFLETIVEKNPDPATKGTAKMCIAEILYDGSPLAMMMGTSDTAATNAKKKRATKMLHDIKNDFAGTELAEEATEFLYAIEHLQVDMKAPEIVGKGADGQEIHLSDFLGKVVAIVFWGTWCEPCMQMLPHEKELLEKHANKPFTILGINADPTLASMKKTMEKEKITWPTIYDGMQDESKIAKKWRVRTFPTIYVIDHKGLIRYKNLMPHQLESAVNDLVAKAVEGRQE